MNELISMDATTLADKIRKSQLTPLEVTGAYIKHIHRVNPHLNAMIQNRFQEAKQEAKKMTNQLHTRQASTSGRLFGVPISIKESFMVKGMKTTGGLPSRQQLVDEQDAEVVRRLKNEGAIILGKTNTPALCFCQETDNTVYGRTNNPWDLSRTVGGSSGGEAALIAVGGAAVGVGSDIGGSIRFPAHFNGVIGFKSGNRQVPSEGSFPPITFPLQEQMLGIGAFSKSVDDSQLIYEIISDHHLEKRDLQTFKVVIPDLPADLPMQSETLRQLQHVQQLLSTEFTMHRDQPPYFQESAWMWQQIMSVDGGKNLVDLAAERGWSSVISDWTKAKIGLKPHLHPYLTWALMGAKMFKPNTQSWEKLVQLITIAQQAVDQYLRDRILILPVYHSTAPQHGKLYSEIFSIRKTFMKYMPTISYANTFGLPTLIMPIGTDEANMPLAVQLITAVGQEDALFQLGRYLEPLVRGYQRCTTFD
ncbi:amidase [Hazenella coriacea]|uniref:Amidase/fatty acid amide hydrolase 2 n=1 Tax=Hazenella coriacea TaxID=1179467 RepID=A0A4R3L7B2_9BACL|nr:amidase [Hazenella coriacea]TCS94925.1 amidase/fatty acid amide hydrolase 2 [Hazenella coriacea]